MSKKFSMPPIGATIQVTTRYRETYYYATNEWRDTTYVGKVLPPERWFKDGDFKLTSDDPKMTFRVINLRAVIDLKVDGVDADIEDVDPSTQYVNVKGKKGNEYTVTIKDGSATSCTCPGFHYRSTCRHLREAVDNRTPKQDNPVTSHRKSTIVTGKEGKTMSKLQSTTIGWGERLAVIEKFNLTDAQATSAFAVSQDELNTARTMEKDGVFTPPADIDFSQYETELKSLEGIKKPTTKTTAPTPAEKPITATKPKKEAKKRGRKGDKIVKAFQAVPSTAVNAEEFAKQHNVSMAVLRQAKRFDTTGLPGAVKVKKDRTAGVLMIWRETA